MRRVCLSFLLVLLLAGSASAHPADTSQMRVQVGRGKVGFRLTMNVLTLCRIAVLDADHDRRITPQEIAKAVPVIEAYLKKKVLITVNDADADLGDFQRYECVWPNSATGAVTDQEASQRYVDFDFVTPWPSGVHEVWLGFQIFGEVGDQHVVNTIYQQEGKPDLPVDFSQAEPDYLYDAEWTGTPEAVEAKAMSAAAPQPQAPRLRGWLVACAVVATGAGWLGGRRPAMRKFTAS